MSFDDVVNYAGGDNLRIAEYYYLMKGHHIGPISYRISEKLNTSQINPMDSGHHVDLVNLGAPRIYTTNYDDLIEKAFQRLGVKFEKIVLPRDVATSVGTVPQVVKYHGDLQYEETLVLTESSYYTRLDLESPMDLKFRADLLGRAVLFIGYSFSDINIRVIWFKLNQMMRDVPREDRPTSYVVTFERNPVLEVLYKDVGITAIVLDPDGKATTSEEKSALMSEFLSELSTIVSNPRIPNSEFPPFSSETAIRKAEAALAAHISQRKSSRNPRIFRSASDSPLFRELTSISRMRIPPEFRDRVSNLFLKNLSISGALAPAISASIAIHGKYPTLKGPNCGIIYGLTKETGRDLLRSNYIDWERVWESQIDQEFAQLLIRTASIELEGHSSVGFDYDLFYTADILKRIAAGSLIVDGQTDFVSDTQNALGEIYERYPDFRDVSYSDDSMPHLDELADKYQLESADGTLGLDDGTYVDDLPF